MTLKGYFTLRWGLFHGPLGLQQQSFVLEREQCLFVAAHIND